MGLAGHGRGVRRGPGRWFLFDARENVMREQSAKTSEQRPHQFTPDGGEEIVCEGPRLAMTI